MKNTFKWLNITQFTGAFNDNAFKMTSIIVLVKLLGQDNLPTIIAACSALFVIPFLLFSNAAGALADRYSKRTIIIASKWMEVALLAIAAPALLSGVAWPVYALLFLLCVQSALFGPSKRAIVPELVEDGDLSRANGFLTAATYAAIILGTALPAVAIGYLALNPLHVVGACAFLAAFGTASAYRIAHVPAFGKREKTSPWILPDVARAIRNLKSDSWASQAVFGLALFGAVTALLQQTLVLYGQEALGLSVEQSPILFPLAAIGIGIGALLTGYFSRHTIEIGLIPVGALGVMLSALGLSVAANPVMIGILIVHLGICCGMFLVPLNAFLQQRIPANRRGEVFGASGFLSFSAMVAASGFFYFLTRTLHLNGRACVLATGLVAAVPAILACMRLPNYLTRFWLMRLVRRLYRIRFQGVENLPREGGALLICNHTAYADPLLLQAATQRPVRFLMSRDVFKTWKWCKPIFKLTDCIPIHTSDGPRALAASLKEARKALENGSIVAIFPEGHLTPNGNLAKFNKGFEKIARNSGCPIIPAYIGNLWGSIFSYHRGKPGFKRPLHLPYPVSVRFGIPLPTDTPAEEAQRVIAELGAEVAIEESLLPKKTLNHALLRQARRNWFRPIASDTLGHRATYGKLLAGSIALASRIKPDIKHQRNVGIFMPTSVGGLFANLAVTLSGKTAVNINWTASKAAQRSALRQAGVKCVISSRRFIRKMEQPDIPVNWIYLEDELESINWKDRLAALWSAFFASAGTLAGSRAPAPTDAAAIIFSSGSTGDPKGVVLSHSNLLSNVESTQAVQCFSKRDSMCGILPLFHAFGYLGLMWWPLLKGVRIAYHPDPLQTGRVMELIKQERLTALLATPTFLQGYMRKASLDDFRTVETIITGGEKLRPELADQFEQKFSIRPLEGYGCTELSPVALLSTRRNHRSGTAGHPLPGVAVRIVDPVSRQPLPDEEEGLMLVKGPNVMQGYLGQSEKTAEVLNDGWYNTGDIARIDTQGYATITGRLSRFSKIGGEMVPHGTIEEALQTVSGAEEPCIAVVGIPSAEKGEQLAVCYTDKAGDPDTLLSKLRKLDLPNLWIPRPANFLRIPEIPLLGAGKLDLCRLNDMVGIS
jgi:acyl-[acyl-carrier-protein]-phospholipid O-acyltransferase/long-chain-fatty-acid--[acyl-carrier-protein] ligase